MTRSRTRKEKDKLKDRIKEKQEEDGGCEEEVRGRGAAQSGYLRRSDIPNKFPNAFAWTNFPEVGCPNLPFPN